MTGQVIAANIESATEETDDTLLKKRGSQGGYNIGETKISCREDEQ